MPAFSARRASRWVAPRVRAFSEVYWSIGSSRSSGGAAAARPAQATHARTSAASRVRLTLKNLFLADGDGLAPPAFVAGQRDVLARQAGRRAFAVPDREEHVLAGGEVGRVGLPGGPFLAGRAPSHRQEYTADQQQPQMSASHVCILRGKLVRPLCYAD